MYFLRGAPAGTDFGFGGVIVREETMEESEFLGARDHVEPEVVLVRGGAGTAKDDERPAASATLGER